MTARVERSVVVRAPADAVWRALVDGGQLSAWFGDDAELDAFPGGQLAVSEDGRRRRAVVVDIEVGRRLAFRWLPDTPRLGFVWRPDDLPAGTSGEVELTLTEMPGGTLVHVVETAPTHRSAALAPA
ncbi:MAG: SRPBCC domain-containing protein [Acidimicrobiia bacterium]